MRQTGTQDRRGQIRVGGITEQQLGQGFTGLGLGRLAKRISKLLADKWVGVVGSHGQVLDPIRVIGKEGFTQADGVPANRRVGVAERRGDIALGQAAEFGQRRQGLNARLRLASAPGQAPQFGSSRFVRCPDNLLMRQFAERAVGRLE